MSNCKKCMFYNKEYDDNLASDVISDREPRHYCIMHSNGITSAVWKGENKCNDYANKEQLKGHE